MMGDTDTEEAILVFAVPGSWFLLMFFAGYKNSTEYLKFDIYKNLNVFLERFV